MTRSPRTAPAALTRAQVQRLGRCGTPASRGFTLVELAVVIALMAALTAFAVPKLTSGDVLGLDQRAKTTASAAADAVNRTYRAALAAQSWDTELTEQSLADAQAAAGHPLTPAEAAALVARIPRRPDVSVKALAATNPDIGFREATSASPDTETASVGARFVGSTSDAVSSYWVVGIAVNVAPTRGSHSGACWMVQQALNPPAGVHTETYLLFEYTQDTSSTSPAAPDDDQCTGQTAAGLGVDQLRALPQNSAASGDLRGTVWSRPLQVPAAAVTEAQATS